MKNVNLFLTGFLSIALLLGLSACNNDDDDNGVSIGDDGCAVSFKVDGVDYNYDNMGLCVYFDDVLNLSELVAGGDFLLQIDLLNHH